jgi:hypothetical protein
VNTSKDYTLYRNVDQKFTRHCTVRIEGGLEYKTGSKWRPVLQLIHRHADADNEDRIRFGYYSGSKKSGSKKFIARPLEIREEHIPALLDSACQAGVMRKDTVRKLVKVLEKYKK